MPRLALFFVLVPSGAAALLHESAWFRLLVPLLGAGSVPAAAVSAGALLGTAIGSWIGGRLADRTGRPGALLVVAEVLSASLGAAVPPLLDAIARGRTGPLSWTLATALLTLAAVPWGVSIPAAFRWMRPEPLAAGRVFKRLYALDTLGAVLGVTLGVAFAFEALGNRHTVLLASGLELFAGAVVATTLFRHARASREAPPVVARSFAPFVPRMNGSGWGLRIAAALGGAAGVGIQVAWMRRLTPHLGATFPVFSAVLGVHLVGISLGTFLLGPRRARSPHKAVFALTWAGALLTIGTSLAMTRLLDAVAEPWWDAMAAGRPWVLFAWRGAIAALLVLPAVAPGAALLAWWVRVREPATAESGRESGDLVAANSIGGALGGFLCALVLVPTAGSLGALVICAGAILLAGGISLRGLARIATGLLGAALMVMTLARPPSDAAATDRIGLLYSRIVWRPDDTLTRHAREGVMASTLVRDIEGRLEFWVEGSLEASTAPTDRLHLGLLGHLPLVLFEARTDRAPHVALIGLGAGYTAQAAVSHDPASLVVYELEPDVIDAARWFESNGGGVPAAAEVVVDDGRRAVLNGTSPLDVLSSDPVHPALNGSAWLYSETYWRGAIERLSDDGLLVHWMPLYHLVREDLALALRTFAAAVPHPYLFLAGGDALLLGSRNPLTLSLDRLRTAIAHERAAPLRAQGFTSPGRLLALFALDGPALRRLTGPGETNTDDRLLLELRSGWREADDPAATFAWLRTEASDPLALLDGQPDESLALELDEGRALRAALESWYDGDLAASHRLFAALADDDPDNTLARSLRDDAAILLAFELFEEDEEEALALVRDVLDHGEPDAMLRLDAAELFARAGLVDEARALARPLAERHGYPRAHRLARAAR